MEGEVSMCGGLAQSGWSLEAQQLEWIKPLVIKKMYLKTKSGGNFTEKVLFGYVILFGVVAITFFNLGRQWNNIVPEGNKVTRQATDGKADLDLGYHHHGRLQNVEECGCKRRFFYTPPGKHTKRLNSSCSDEGSFYETGQKVVSLSMCIPDPGDTKRRDQYLKGIGENLRRMRKYYPGSSMRVYTDVGLERGSEYCRLVCAHPELHWCDVRKTPSLGDQSEMFLMTWRFLPLGDPTVDYFLSRDLDSVIIERQVAAVNEWLQSDKAFHGMRDKFPEHNALMLGGLWGGRNSVLGMEEAKALRQDIIELAKKPPKKKGRDQIILNQAIFYPKIKDILTFDSYFCKNWAQVSEVRPFPFQRKDTHFDFAGNVELGKAKYDLTKCPVECRPEYGKDWEYC